MSSSHSSGGVLPPCRHLRVNLGDPALVKHTLDEQAAMYVLDQGYVEDVTLSNIKLGFGVFAVLLTVVAQFYPLSFPASAPFLKGCVLVYFAIQGLLQLLHFMVESNCILLTKQRKEGEQEKSEKERERKQTAAQHAANAGKKKKGAAAAIALASASADSTPAAIKLPTNAVSLQANLSNHCSEYQLTLATRTSESVFASLSGRSTSSVSSSSDSAAASGGNPLAAAVSATLSVTDYFDTEGIFLLERYHAALAELVAAYAEEVKRVQAEAKKSQ